MNIRQLLLMRSAVAAPPPAPPRPRPYLLPPPAFRERRHLPKAKATKLNAVSAKWKSRLLWGKQLIAERRGSWNAHHDKAYPCTAMAVVACVRQFPESLFGIGHVFF